jgi:NADH:ubiquinone oxidoreductase subunit E
MQAQTHLSETTPVTKPDDRIFALDRFIDEHLDEPGILIPVLQEAQELFGYLPSGVLAHISDRLSIPPGEVAGVVTFYSFFSTVPRGEHMVRVCLGTACYVRGGNEVLEALKKELDIDVGGTTDDRQFSLSVGRYFGPCGLAPVVMIDDDVHQRVKPGRVRDLLDPYRKGATE